MPLFSRILSFILRIAEIAFAAIVAGIIGKFLDEFNRTVDDWAEARWIYTEVIAGISILLGLIWVIPYATSFFAWPLDIIISLAWFAAFGVLVDGIHRLDCGSIWQWGIITQDSVCGRWKAAEAFSFLSAIVWLVSGLVGLWFALRIREAAIERGSHRRWFRGIRHSAV